MFDLILFRDKQYRSYIILAVIITLAIAWTNFGHNTGDEYSQIFEYAGYKLGYVNYADIRLAEFDGHMRPSIQVWMVIAVYKLVGLFCTQVNPFVVNYIIYVFSGLLSIVAVVLFSQLVIEQIDVKLRKWFVIFSLFSWLVLYTSVHFNSDSICGKFFLIGLFFVLENKNQASYIKLFCGGLLFALAFACRFQIGFAIAGVMVYWLVVAIRQRAGYLNIVIITLAILLGIFIFNIVADYYFYGTWVFSPYGYYYYNIATGTMSGFGVSPWYTYFLMVAGYLPFGPFYVLASFYYIYKKPKSIYTTIILSYCILHIIIGHKEVRFLMPMLVFMPLVVFILLQDMLVKYTWVKHNINWIIKNFAS